MTSITTLTWGAAITLAWNPSPTADVTAYRMWRSIGTGPFGVVLTTNVLSATVTASDVDSTRFFVTALNSFGDSAPSNVLTNVVTVTPPPTNAPPVALQPPTNLRLVRIRPTLVQLAWGSPDLSLATRIEQSIEGGPFFTLATVAPGATTFEASVNKRKTSYFQARSFDGRVTSVPSNGVIFGQ